MVTPAIKNKTSQLSSIQIAYMVMASLLNLPAGVVPITKVEEGEEWFYDSYQDKFTRAFVNTMKESKGLPVGVQVIGLQWKD